MDKLLYERKHYENGAHAVAGVDEVGRGPLAGPVVCCAVIMPLDDIVEGVDDSKKLTEKKRETLAEIIKQKAVAYCIAQIESEEIDQVNILNAVKKCMTNAVNGLNRWQQAKANHHGGQRKEGAFDFGSAGSSTTDTPQRQDSQQVKAVQGDTGTNLRYQFFNDCYSQAAIPTPHYETKTEGRPEQALQEAYYGVQKESARPVAQTEAAMRQSVQRPSLQSASEPDDLPQLRYLGTTQGVYLVVELGDSLYLIDQHAAHERLLFNRFIAQAGQRQHLLVPYVVETSSDADDEYLRSLTARLEAAGFETKECGEGRWEFSSVPLQWQGTEADLEQDLLAKRIIPEELVASLASTNACRHAVMDGTVLDEATATQLAKDTLALEDPHCPHGRPLWLKISREDMDQGVKRT